MIIIDINILRKPCKDASIIEADSIIKKLEIELLNSPIKGVGLSANQIGIDSRICIIRTDKISLDLINPIIVKSYDLCSFKDDGCLSVPRVFVTTQRYNEILIKDILHSSGIIAIGMEAVIIQHEIDHTNGILMLDRQIIIPERNEKCWCNSGKKYKVCHYGKEIK